MGNVLTSAIINLEQMRSAAAASRFERAAQLSAMLKEHQEDLVGFLTRDPRGRVVPDYRLALTEEPCHERTQLQTNLHEMGLHLEHIHAIIRVWASRPEHLGCWSLVASPPARGGASDSTAGKITYGIPENVCVLRPTEFDRKAPHEAQSLDKLPPRNAMDAPKGNLLRWLLCFAVGALAAGCASSASGRLEEASGDRGGDQETSEQLPDESAYREAAEKLLEFLDEQRQAGASVIHASGTDGIRPMYECMDYGCPDRVFCKDANAYCHVTLCSKGSCRGCPESFPDFLKNLMVKEWCKFDCLRGSTRAGTAFGFIPIVGKKFFVGPVCLDE